MRTPVELILRLGVAANYHNLMDDRPDFTGQLRQDGIKQSHSAHKALTKSAGDLRGWRQEAQIDTRIGIHQAGVTLGLRTQLGVAQRHDLKAMRPRLCAGQLAKQPPRIVKSSAGYGFDKFVITGKHCG